MMQSLLLVLLWFGAALEPAVSAGIDVWASTETRFPGISNAAPRLETARIPDIIIDGDAEFRRKVEECLQTLLEADAETAAIVRKLEGSDFDHVISESAGGNGMTPNSEDDANPTGVTGTATGNGTGSTIRWNPTKVDPYSDGTARDPCASLLHELKHACDANEGELDPRPGAGGIRKEEVDACREENRYRKRAGLPQRTEYGGKALPADARF